MAKSELTQSISTLSSKIDKLLEQLNALHLKVNQLEEANRELELRHQADLEQLRRASQEIEFLSMSHRLASSPEAILSARNKISQLIRTIDSCIRIIKED